MANIQNSIETKLLKPIKIALGVFALTSYVLLMFDDDVVFRSEDGILMREERSESVDGNYKPITITRGTYG